MSSHPFVGSVNAWHEQEWVFLCWPVCFQDPPTYSRVIVPHMSLHSVGTPYPSVVPLCYLTHFSKRTSTLPDGELMKSAIFAKFLNFS